MGIPVQMLKEHAYKEDARSSRTLPRGWVGELDEEVAIGVIAINSARPLRPLNADQKHHIDVVRAAIAGDEERVRVLLEQGEDGKPPAPPAPSTTVAKLIKEYEGPDDTGQATKLAKGVRVNGEFADKLIADGFAEAVKPPRK